MLLSLQTLLGRCSPNKLAPGYQGALICRRAFAKALVHVSEWPCGRCCENRQCPDLLPFPAAFRDERDTSGGDFG